jgi:hypothetical protein
MVMEEQLMRKKVEREREHVEGDDANLDEPGTLSQKTLLLSFRKTMIVMTAMKTNI